MSTSPDATSPFKSVPRFPPDYAAGAYLRFRGDRYVVLAVAADRATIDCALASAPDLAHRDVSFDPGMECPVSPPTPPPEPAAAEEKEEEKAPNVSTSPERARRASSFNEPIQASVELARAEAARATAEAERAKADLERARLEADGQKVAADAGVRKAELNLEAKRVELRLQEAKAAMLERVFHAGSTSPSPHYPPSALGGGRSGCAD